MDKSESRKENRNGEKRRFDPDLLKKGLRCDLDQYEMLKRCSDKKDMTEWNEWRKNNPTENILLEGADLSHVYLKMALLNTSLNSGFSGDIYLQYAKFHGAHMEDADLSSSYLQGVKFIGTHLQGLDMRYAHIESADFRRSIVNGSTLLWRCIIDRHTDFRGVGLDKLRIESGTKQLLEYNIRRKNWQEWYPKQNCFLRCIVRAFWCVSDYGISSPRIIKVFLVSAVAFAILYYLWGVIAPLGILDNLFVDRNGVVVPWWVVPFRAFYFSIITMTLGFSDMYANAQSVWGHILITIQALLGYVLLGALVTRFAVLFTAGGPAGKFADEKKEKATESTERHRENR
jgi:hypothetical protein